MATEKQPKKRSRAGVVILVIFLLILLMLAGGAGYLYYSVVKAPLEPDDPHALAAAAPMSAAERFEFSAAEGTAQIKFSKADFWNMVVTHAGDDFMDKLNEELSAYGLSLSGCAIDTSEEGVRLDMELYYKETRLVVRMPCDLKFTGQHISLKPTELKVGPISLTLKALLSTAKVEYDVILPVITEVTGIHFTRDAVLLTGPVEEDIRSLIPGEEKLLQCSAYSSSQQMLAEVLLEENGIYRILTHLEKNPADIEALYQNLFILAEPEVTEQYLEDRQGLTERFLPGTDFDAAAQAQSDLNDDLFVKSAMLENFFTELVGNYNDKNFKLSGGQFIKKKKVFNAAQYGAGKHDALFENLDPETMFLILVDAQDGHIRKTSSFYRMADEKQEFTQPVDFNKTYILGLVFRSIDGEPYLMYESEIQGTNTYSRKIKLVPLTEEEVSALQVEGKFGVWIG